jgi:DNA mismatch repair protein MutL
VSRIRILPEITSNKIAAGEVVERPASVVKELVENAIDAGSTRVMIEIENGGRSLIRVSDDGEGMTHDDALLSLERYATSKIEKDSDLFSIRTLGFRGEALPSISSVSRFTMVTRDRQSDAGTSIDVAGGRIKKVAEAGAPPGTMISVKQLFYNTPARRKFLKSTTTEMGHIAETVANMALGWPAVQFRLSHNGKTVKDWPKVENAFDRVTAVLGQGMRGDLHEIAFKGPGAAISGWISSPSLSRSTSQRIYLFVNRRFIRDRGLQHALFEGYRGRLMKGRFPVAVLFIQVPHERLDVNVHPTKHEVRFSGYREVYEGLKAAVFNAWDKMGRSPWAEKRETGPGIQDGPHRPVMPAPREKEIPFDPGETNSRETNSRETNSRETNSRETALVSDGVSAYGPAAKGAPPEPGQETAAAPPPGPGRDAAREPEETGPFAGLQVVGQLHDTYIVCEAEDGIVLVDHHAAHERILFEQMKALSAASPFPVQKLLIPETLDLGYREMAVFEKLKDGLHQMGLEAEPFGGDTIVVKSVPALIAGGAVAPLILELIEKAADIGFSEGLGPVLDECLILVACHAALRANHHLSPEEMKALIKQLAACENPSQCPHGRPTWIKWTLSSLEKSFKRVV